MNKQIVKLIALLFCALPILSSCVEEEIVERTPAVGSSRMMYDMNGYQNLTTAKDMTILTRKLYVSKFRFNYDGSSFTQEYPSVKTKNYIDSIHSNKFLLGLGEFRSVAFNKSSTAFDVATLKAEMANPTTARLDSFMVTYKLFEKDSYTIRKVLSSFTDYNTYKNADSTYSSYVTSNDNNFVTGVSENVTLEKDDEKITSFKWTTLSQPMTVSFDITKDPHGTTEFKIDRIYGILSGIPAGVDFTDANVDTKNTHKIVFKADFTDYDPTSATAYERSTYYCKVDMNAAGIVSNSSGSSVNGPGVLQLVIVTTVKTKTGTRKKTINALCNINKSLKIASLMKRTEKGYVRNEENKGVNISLSTFITDAMLKTNSQAYYVFKD